MFMQYNHILIPSAHLSNFPNVKRRILLYLEPLAKLLGSRLGSVLPILGVNIPNCPGFRLRVLVLEGPAASQEAENKGIDVFSTERRDTGG